MGPSAVLVACHEAHSMLRRTFNTIPIMRTSRVEMTANPLIYN